MVALVVSLLALSGAALALFRVKVGSTPPDTPRAPAYDDSELRNAVVGVLEELGSLRADYEEFRSDIITAVDEGIRDVKRRENRIRATVRRAREELEEGGIRSPGLEAEARDLLEEHGTRGDEGGMHPVQPHVANVPAGDRFAAFPGSWDGYGG